MLEKIFLQILDMSFTAGFVVLFVLLARIFLKKLPKVFSYALWGVVLFRLVCPFSFESVFSLLPIKTNAVSQDIIYKAAPAIDAGIPVINNSIQQLLPAATPTAGANPLQAWILIGAIAWLLGMAILLIYSIVSLVKLQRSLSSAVLEKDNIYLAEHLDIPFVMGIIRPKIYLPVSLTGEEKRYILLHEQTHIKRFDHLVKIISSFVLCLHWFNPLVWAAFFVSGRDMEMSCDEAVIKGLGGGIKKEYSSSLLTLATGRRIIGGTPLAFGEGDTRDRVKNILNYKKPAFWMAVAAVLATIIIAVGLVANPVNSIRLPEADDMNISTEMLDRVVYGSFIAGNKAEDFPQAKTPEIADFIENLRISKEVVSTNRDGNRDSTNQIHLAYEGFGNRKTIYNLYFNFSADFTQIWLDDETKPSLSYQVKRPEDVKAFFRRQFNSMARAVKIGSVEELWEARTKYIGDNSAVGKIISLLQFPKGVVYDSFELHTSGHPYAVTVNFKTDSETRNFYSGADKESPFQINALIMFSLIENAEYVTFSLDDGIYDPYSVQYTSDMAKMILGDSYREESETLEGFNIVLQKIWEKVSAGNENISPQKDDDGLTFWVKPDESPQVIGNTAAAIWLKSFMGAHVPAESRISNYNITKVDVIAGTPKAGVKWEDMAYQYVVRIRYDISTATEEFFNPGDGVSGQGTFEGLFVELCVKVKTTDGGGYRIVSAGTGGGTQEFANP